MKVYPGLAIAATLVARFASAEVPGPTLPGQLALPPDICEIVDVCAPADSIGLTGAMAPAAIPDWAYERLQGMNEAGVPEARRSGYARAMSDRTLVDWCDVCKCCAISHDTLMISPEAFKDSGLTKGITILEGQ